jgi:hypothetical protein
MAQQFPSISDKHREFIEKQHMFFVASTADGARINLSPKGLDGLRVLDQQRVCYLDLTGSGAETSAHMLADGRLTLMLCAFEGAPLILRLYGHGRMALKGTEEYAKLLAGPFAGVEPPGARQIVILEVELVQTSCGFGVPLYDYVGERPSLIQWAEFKGEDGLEEYRREKNARSIDGLPTGMFEV